MVAQEIVGLEVLEAEAGTAGGVDLHDALDAERVRVFAFRDCRLGCGSWGRRGGRRRCGGAEPALRPVPAHFAPRRRHLPSIIVIARCYRQSATHLILQSVAELIPSLFIAALTRQVNVGPERVKIAGV